MIEQYGRKVQELEAGQNMMRNYFKRMVLLDGPWAWSPYTKPLPISPQSPLKRGNLAQLATDMRNRDLQTSA